MDSPSFECVLSAWKNHESELLNFLIHQRGNRDLAEDLLQDVFIKSMRQGQAFCRLENPRAWLFQVARNALIDHARTAHSSEALPDHLAMETDTSRAPVDELDHCIARNLLDLTVDDRDIIERCDLQEWTVSHYAVQRQLSLAAAKSRLLRARQRLRDLLIRNCQVKFDPQGQVCCHTPRKKE